MLFKSSLLLSLAAVSAFAQTPTSITCYNKLVSSGCAYQSCYEGLGHGYAIKLDNGASMQTSDLAGSCGNSQKLPEYLTYETYRDLSGNDNPDVSHDTYFNDAGDLCINFYDQSKCCTPTSECYDASSGSCGCSF